MLIVGVLPEVVLQIRVKKADRLASHHSGDIEAGVDRGERSRDVEEAGLALPACEQRAAGGADECAGVVGPAGLYADAAAGFAQRAPPDLIVRGESVWVVAFAKASSS